jgi:hypothetical protein
MRKLLILGVIGFFLLSSCSDDNLDIKDVGNGDTDNKTELARLNFDNEFSLEKAIEDGFNGDNQSNLKNARSYNQGNFVSLMTKIPKLKSNVEEENITYYEALGFDSLVPNPNFAALLNIRGELEVGKDIIRITPNGTYKYPMEYEDEFNDFIIKNPDFNGDLVDENIYKINESITLCKTFEENPNDFLTLSEGNYTELPDDFFGNDEDDAPTILKAASSSEPDFNSFQTFSADRKTWAGKLIQSIIGSTKASTVNFNKKRRIRGSFYFYNYGVYSEIGVKGWTDKKNWIGWSKTASDELRVGWNNVVLKSKIPDYYKQSLKDLNSMVLYPTKLTWVNGQLVNVATLAMPEFKPTFRDRVLSKGVKAMHSYLKNELKRPASEWEKAEAFLVATRTELYYVSGKQDVVKYNTKYYCHVFANHWMEFEVGYSNSKGIFINGIGQNNYAKADAWFKAITKTFSEKRTTLESGEVYTCARLGNEWRGMKIVKK